MSWNHFISKEKCIERMARHYNEDIEKIRKDVEKNPQILDGYAEYLENGV